MPNIEQVEVTFPGSLLHFTALPQSKSLCSKSRPEKLDSTEMEEKIHGQINRVIWVTLGCFSCVTANKIGLLMVTVLPF